MTPVSSGVELPALALVLWGAVLHGGAYDNLRYYRVGSQNPRIVELGRT